MNTSPKSDYEILANALMNSSLPKPKVSDFNFTEFRNQVLSGAADQQLGDIMATVQARRRTIDMTKMSVVKVGDSVQLKAKMNPKYLAGSIARVTKIMNSYVTIDLLVPITGPQGKSWHRNIRCPISIIEGIIPAKEGA